MSPVWVPKSNFSSVTPWLHPNLVWKQRGGDECYPRIVDTAGGCPQVWRAHTSSLWQGKCARRSEAVSGDSSSAWLTHRERLMAYSVESLNNFYQKKSKIGVILFHLYCQTRNTSDTLKEIPVRAHLIWSTFVLLWLIVVHYFIFITMYCILKIS